MKKTVIVLFALFLALPTVSFAGSATSRWDLTIGGFVKFDMGYNTQAQGQDAFFAQRSGVQGFQNQVDRYGNFFSYAGETRLNFLTKGPDAFGAKTSAFVEGHFRGAEAGSGSGAFVLRHAFMQFDWPTSKLIIGQTWQKFGIIPTFANQILDYNGLGPFFKGGRQPLIRFEQNITKNWNWALGAISATNTLGSNASNTNTGVVDSFTLSGMPFFEGSLGWTSDKCGNIGPWKMLFNLDGFYGRQKQVTQYGNAGTGIAFASKDVDAWGIAFKGFIPVIPEKKGNKAGALSLSGVLFYTQNPGNAYNMGGPNSYAIPNYGQVGFANSYLDPSYHAPKIFGGWGQISYFIRDNLFINGWYGYVRNNLSNGYIWDAQNLTPAQNAIIGVVPTTIQNHQQITANIMYDVNAAMRFGFEYSCFITRYVTQTLTAAGSPYGPNIPITQKDGTMHMFRIGAFYFF